MSEILSEKQLHELFNEQTQGDITENLTVHEFKVVGILSTLLLIDDSKGLLPPLKELRKAYRIGGIHINVIDRADDILDGERGFKKRKILKLSWKAGLKF